ncbi:MAG TPA: DNA-formamidopyrimidine glycosylase family protein [Alphaproteobacteria bacterium]|jgi:formamidopyrimidine-DNA glycosylase
MPELPDIAAYIRALETRVNGVRLERVRLRSPFFLRTVEPPLAAAMGAHVAGLERLGKRIVFALDGDLYLILHLMIAGRLWWHDFGKEIPGGGRGLAAFDFESGTLVVTEAGTKKRASLHLVQGRAALAAHDPGGADPFALNTHAFAALLRAENHTIKRTLTDPRVLSGIGNSYSDEILHRARLSPVLLTQRMTEAEMMRLHGATRSVLREWTERLVAEAERAWPEKVTAFREGMAVHGRYGKPCPVCGAPIQRIRYADNETNYCARCQTSGKLLADRSLSRLLHKDWPKTLDELELLRPANKAPTR